MNKRLRACLHSIVLVSLALSTVSLPARQAQGQQQSVSRTFTETGKTVSGKFLHLAAARRPDTAGLPHFSGTL